MIPSLQTKQLRHKAVSVPDDTHVGGGSVVTQTQGLAAAEPRLPATTCLYRGCERVPWLALIRRVVGVDIGVGAVPDSLGTRIQPGRHTLGSRGHTRRKK